MIAIDRCSNVVHQAAIKPLVCSSRNHSQIFSAVYISLWRREFLSNPRVYMSLYRLPYRIQWKCWSPLARDRCQPRWEFPLLLNSPAVAEHSHDMTAVLFQGSDVSFLIQPARSNTVNTHTNLGPGNGINSFWPSWTQDTLKGDMPLQSNSRICSTHVRHIWIWSKTMTTAPKNQLMIATFDGFSWLSWLLDMLK